MPERICDVCAGLLGLTPYDPRIDGPHVRAEAWEAVAVLTGTQPPLRRPGRIAAPWCSRLARHGWCPTCRSLLSSAAHTAGVTLLAGVTTEDLHAAYQRVLEHCAPAPGPPADLSLTWAEDLSRP